MPWYVASNCSMASTHLRRSSALPGTEQPALAGLADQRTALWPHYDNSTAMYAFLSRVNAIRRSYGLGPGGSDMMTEAMVVGDPSQRSLLFVRRIHSVDCALTGSGLSGLLAWGQARGRLLVRLSNLGSASGTGASGDSPGQSCVEKDALGPQWAGVCGSNSANTHCTGVRANHVSAWTLLRPLSLVVPVWLVFAWTLLGPCLPTGRVSDLCSCARLTRAGEGSPLR